MKTTDRRPTVRAIQRQRVAIKAEMERRHEPFQMGYLMGIDVALMWMTEKDTAPPTVMVKSMRDMLAHDRRRRHRRKRASR